MATNGDNETVSKWYARLKQVTLKCKFGSNLEALFLNQFIISLPGPIFERISDEDENLSLS